MMIPRMVNHRTSNGLYEGVGEVTLHLLLFMSEKIYKLGESGRLDYRINHDHLAPVLFGSYAFVFSSWECKK